MRKLVADGKCERCGATGAVWQPHVKVLNFGQGTVIEPKAVGPTLCDDCEYAGRT